MSNALLGCRVLVVEDEVLVSWALEDMLAGLGCQVVGPAVRVNQGLALVEAGSIDAAVLDVNLNGQKSYPIADALVAQGVPFAFLAVTMNIGPLVLTNIGPPPGV